ncbi:hypothetical protein [uncultured Succinatimonas sp.]|uniref:hypothetical protein n=1 Tax=uncultured Succinatimonas sp. TaxID=1262973 RepID=UPI0025D980AF|nr:hypothetical protein [uncultured Succinatimonas sp.]
MPALLHYELFGRKEKRNLGDGNSYLPRYSLKDLFKCIFYTRTLDLNKYREYKLLKTIINSKYFDYKWYKTTYHINGNKKRTALHFLTLGWKLGYNPSVKFSCKDFLLFYSDVNKLNINPLVFYECNKKSLIPSTIKGNIDFLLLSAW